MKTHTLFSPLQASLAFAPYTFWRFRSFGFVIMLLPCALASVGLLGGLDRCIAKKRDLKQAAMQQLLTGQTRLPGFAPASPKFEQTVIGLIPEDWSHD